VTDYSAPLAVNKGEQLQAWINQIVPITFDLRMATLNKDWKQAKHFNNLIQHNLYMITKLSEELSSNELTEPKR
jgi:hypothetical protein